MLISRDDILESMGDEFDTRLFRLVARFTRNGYHLLATASQPDNWSSRTGSQHGGPDDALLGPHSIRKRLADAGGVLDGVYYVPRSLLTQKRNRVEALEDMMHRYAVSPDQCYLFSSAKNYVAVAKSLGIHATHLNSGRKLLDELKLLSEKLLN